MQTNRTFRAPSAIFWSGLVLRLLCILIGHTYKVRVDEAHFNFGFEAGRIARSLVLGRGYANPFNGISGPTAWLPPLYPLLIALAFKLFGIYTNAAALFLLTCNSIFSALIAPAIYEIAARCFDASGIARRASKHAAPVALGSAWLWALYPAALQYAIHWIWEMSLSTCLFTWTLVLALRLRQTGDSQLASGIWNLESDNPTRSPSPRRNFTLWILFGLLWGLTALSNASLLLVFPATLLWILWPYDVSIAHLKRNLTGALLACVVFSAVLSPWIIRNEQTLHAFIPTRDNLGVELWQSTHFYYGVFPWGQAVPLSPLDPEHRLYVQMGEVAYSQMRMTQARANIAAHPHTFLRLTLERIQCFWFGVPHPTEPHPANEILRELNFSFLSVAGLLGLALALRRRVPTAWLFAAVFLLVPAAYYIVTVQARFRHPLEPLIAILTVYLFRSTTSRRATLTKP